MRQSELYFRLSLKNTHGVTDGIQWWKDNIYINSNKTQLSSAGKYSFTNCKWESCTSSTTGGAISLSESTSSLNILSCMFSTCGSSSDGGAVYTVSLSTLLIIDSFFNACTVTRDTSNAGGVYALSITQCVRVDNTNFIQNEGYRHGNALFIQQSNSNAGSDSSIHPGTAISNGRFVSCCMKRYDATAYLKTGSGQSINNCLFANNYAKRWAGAVRLDVDTLRFDENGNALPYLLFDFFSNNQADKNYDGKTNPKSQAGQNVYLVSTDNIYNIGHKCFALSFAANDVYGNVRYHRSTDDSDHSMSNWFPQDVERGI